MIRLGTQKNTVHLCSQTVKAVHNSDRKSNQTVEYPISIEVTRGEAVFT